MAIIPIPTPEANKKALGIATASLGVSGTSFIPIPGPIKPPVTPVDTSGFTKFVISPQPLVTNTGIDINKLIQAESSGNPNALATGYDNKTYAGLTGMGEAAWQDVNVIRAREGKPLYPYAMKNDPNINKEYGNTYLNIRVPEILKSKGIEANDLNKLVYYGGWSEEYKKAGGDINKMPKSFKTYINNVIGDDGLLTQSDMPKTAQTSSASAPSYATVAKSALEKYQQAGRAVGDFLRPENEKEASKMGMIKFPGTKNTYQDLLGWTGALEKVGTKVLAEVAKRSVSKLGTELESKIPQLKTEVKALEELLDSSPAKKLAKFANANGELPEVIGGTSAGGRTGATSKFGISGDTFVTELGFADSEEARAAYQIYREGKAQLATLKNQLDVTSTRVQNLEALRRLNPADEKISAALERAKSGTPSAVAKQVIKDLPEPTTALKLSKEATIDLSELKAGRKTLPTKSSTIIPSGEIASLEPIIKDTFPTVKNKANIIDYARTPEKVLQKMGLGKEAKLLRNGYEGYLTDLNKNFEYLQGLRKEVPAKQASERIFKYLDGQDMQLTANEQAVADKIKRYLADWADKLNIPEQDRITNYITHIFDEQLVMKEFDPDLAKMIADKIPGSVMDPFLMKRYGIGGFKQDVWEALSAYVKRATRKVNMDPALEALQRAGSKVDLESYKYIKAYADRINLRPTHIDNLIDNFIKSTPIGYKLGQRPVAAVTRMWRRMVYRGALGLNFGSALRNLTQGVNTYAALGEKYTILGYMDLFKMYAGDGLRELKATNVLSEGLIQDKGLRIAQGVTEKLDKTLWSVFGEAEKINRGAAYFGAKRKAIAMGMSESKAIDYATGIVRKTQFAFGSIDTPLMMSSDIAKAALQFQSYNIKQVEFLADMVASKDFAGIIRYITGSMVILYTIGDLLGMDYKSLLPSFKIGGSPIGNVITGTKEFLSSNPKTKESGKTKLENAAVLTAPAGVQIRKTVKGVSQYMAGQSDTSTGKKRFDVGQSTSNLVRGALLGPTGFKETAGYNEGVSNLIDILNDQTENRANLANQAEDEFDKIRAMPKEERVDYYKKLYKENPELAQKIDEVGNDAALGLDYQERLIKQLGVANGERAKYVINQILELKEAGKMEEVKKLWIDYQAKKILTEEVIRQINEYKPK